MTIANPVRNTLIWTIPLKNATTSRIPIAAMRMHLWFKRFHPYNVFLSTAHHVETPVGSITGTSPHRQIQCIQAPIWCFLWFNSWAPGPCGKWRIWRPAFARMSACLTYS